MAIRESAGRRSRAKTRAQRSIHVGGLAAALCLYGAATLARAQVSPLPSVPRPLVEDQRQQERERALRQQQERTAGEGGNDNPIGRCLGTEGVDIVIARLQRAIVDRGYVTTRVLAAPQDLSRGTLSLSLIPGRIAAIHFAEGSGASTRTSLAAAIPPRPGDLLDLLDIEQGPENLPACPYRRSRHPDRARQRSGCPPRRQRPRRQVRPALPAARS